MQELLTYQTYPSADLAYEAAEQLQGQGITTEVLKTPQILGSAIIGSSSADHYLLKIDAADFARANKILFSGEELDINSVPPDHPLRTMSNDELHDIISKPDEWGPDNYKVALALLKSKGADVSGDKLLELERSRIQTLSVQKSMSSFLLLTGYAVAFLPFIILTTSILPFYLLYFPGAYGLIVGMVAVSSKNTLPDGRRVLTYTNSTRIHGVIIIILNILFLIINFNIFEVVRPAHPSNWHL